MESKEVNKHSFGEIWKVLSAVNCDEFTEEKVGLTFLSWGGAWGLLMNLYPSAHFEFDENEMHEDGTVTVNCNLMIGSCLRTMWLPVMNYKNEAIVKPNAREISDNKMRCLVKTMALYGLGWYIYCGLDAPVNGQEETETQEKPKKAAKKKVAPKKAAPRKEEVKEKAVDPEPQPETPESEDSGQLPSLTETKIGNPEQAGHFVDLIAESAKAFCSSPSSLKDFYRKNQSQFDYLDQNFPEQYEVLKNSLHELMDSLEGVKK